ncbi:uroporphyrinogen-III synthase [Flavobacterium album]|uniref:Uroporphyrinogen-III synthase n=1 Tax=Flavobacterium album TaxID=2175091 RepID=A0A2S1QVV9_9FLAO|nr:uroporphyrinogen-III synthase [Flavobacterium album]AWH84524.1 uroporphyrinogen-III synthase [Flavobacterium album]
MRILSSKKLQPNHRQFLLNAGLAVLEADFISISYKPFELNDISPNLIFTSQNAFKSFSENEKAGDYKSHPVFCVGSKTREAIEKAGFKVLAFAEYAEGLAEIIIKDYTGESFTFFSGSMRRDTLPDALANAGIAFNEIEVYETVLSPQKINAPLDGILFFSPSGVESYLKENSIGNAVCFCIGNTTSKALEGITSTIVIANKPTVENVVVQCVNYYRNL